MTAPEGHKPSDGRLSFWLVEQMPCTICGEECYNARRCPVLLKPTYNDGGGVSSAHVQVPHDIGTPPAAEKKARRMMSPMHAMDDGQGGDVYEDGPIRQPLFETAPPTQAASAVTLEGIQGLLQEEMAPTKNNYWA